MVEWVYEWEKPCTPFYAASFFTVYTTTQPLFFGAPGPTMMIGRKHRVTMFWGKAYVEQAGKWIENKILTNPHFIQEYAAGTEKLLSEMHAAGRKAVRELSPDFFADYWTAYWRASIPVGTIRLFNRTGVAECEKWLSQKIPDAGKQADALSVLTGTAKESFAQKEQKAFREIFLEARKFKKLFSEKTPEEMTAFWKNDERFAELRVLVQGYLKEYNWFPCGYDNEEAWDEVFVASEVKQALSSEDKTLARLELAEEYPKKLAEQKRKLVEELQPPDDISRIFAVLSEFTFFKDHIRENLNRFHYATRSFLRAVSEAVGLKDLECTELAPWDLARLLREKKKAVKPLLGEGDYALYFHARAGEQKVFVGRKALDLYGEAVGLKTTAPAVVKGVGASPGRAVGRVKLVFRPRHYAGEKNIVLVAPMTNPDLVPAMRNAVAVVTHEGGVTCHAAIISRELGIPCVVGTKVVTKAFKDGDVVEVDATRGIVKKLR